MGLAVTFVMLIAASISWIVNNYILIPYGMEFLKYISFILIIASMVQFVEMFIKKFIQPL
jgi:electron transport complex protein RnfA